MAKAAGVSWPLDDEVSNKDLQEILFPGKYVSASPYTMPDFAYIHKELAKPNVTLSLLWEEYCPGTVWWWHSLHVFPVL